ncbi:uncharacterized protein CXQ87_003077 [Candidozyma duobushaemuli]|uniref:Uncharacterized protein n=2 Tax=Candidozyma TaxID=3303203 RepID=A0ABX8IAZ9_9ASCO|nr:uncharacterized protein CXQ87_003077 [[Candida] duobushaemulonis]PVH15239.1 hypothetical protein CXQ87_003077 [[Candida] duobushaemulonis]QWU88483.1 hypothetical protein CA3LBN_002791 [[Candida] haemuloni]
MGKRQPANENLSILRCKRMIRPLISKIAALTDIYIKYPSKFDLDIESFDIVQRNHGKSLSFISPATSDDRLLYLKPYLSPELHQAYKEIFVIFKNIILAWSQTSSNSRIPKLSSLASYKLGKCITLGTKSSHYRLSKTALFDADTLPKYLQKYHDELSDDIDDWLTMEPESVMETHRTDLLYGYLIHLLVFNSRTIFYCLLPVLVHWLHEQKLYSLSRTLLYEFFLFSSVDIDQREVSELTTEVAQHDPSLPVFWLFHNIGYWRRLCELCKLTTMDASNKRFQSYDSIFIEILAKTDRLFLTDGIDLQHIYDTLQSNPQHPHNTFILTSILAQIISLFKKSLDSASTSSASLMVFRASLNDFTEFLRTWLSLSGDCVFNSFDGGNEDIFDAVENTVDYMLKHCIRAVRYLEGVSSKSRSVELVLEDFKNIHHRILAFQTNAQILHAYYLDKPELYDVNGAKITEVSRSLGTLMAHNCEYNEVIEFLVWFRDLENPQGYKLSKALFKHFFREDSVLGDMDIDHVAWELYDL